MIVPASRRYHMPEATLDIACLECDGVKMGQSCFIITDSFEITVFTRISAAMLVKIFTLLFEAALI